MLGTNTNRSRFILLGILCRGSATGYELRRAIEKSTGFFWKESFGQIYPSLAAMQKENLVKLKREDQGRKRIEYSITKKGKKILQQWLAEPYLPAIERNELLLKIFFGGLADKDTTTLHLEQARKEAEEYLEILKGIQSELKHRFPAKADRFHYEATIEYGIVGMEVLKEWSKNQIQKWNHLQKLVDAKPSSLP